MSNLSFEERAHDLAIAYLKGQMDKGQIEVSVNDHYIDYVCCYFDTYTTILDQLRKHSTL